MTAAEYWQERDVQNATHLFMYSDRQAQLVTRWFGRAAREMDSVVRDFIRKYADNNQITYKQAKAELSDRAALKELTEHYEKLLAVAPSDPVVNSWVDRLHTAKNINREEFLKAQLQVIASEAFAKYADRATKSLTTLFEESYYKSLFDQQQYVGFGSNFNRLSVNFIQAATSTKWSGKNYSQAIWGDHRVSLARYINRIVTTGVIEGKSNQIISAELQKAMSTSSYNARRLIRTEGSYVANRGSLLGYREFGTENYKFLSTLDFKTSVKCRNMDGKVFAVAEAKQGINIPPLHPFCRSTTIPDVPDEEFDQGDTRAARDGKGNTYRVPADMQYKDWYDQHVKPHKEELLAEQKYKSGNSDAKQWKRYRETLEKDAPSSLDKFQNLKYTDASGYGDLKRQYRRGNYDNAHAGNLNEVSLEPIPITQQVIDDLQTPPVPGWSDDRNVKLNMRHKELLEYAQRQQPGIEVAAYLDKNLNTMVTSTGKTGNVSMDLTKGAVYMHNHPSGHTFTLPDVERLLFNDNMRYLSAVGNNGNIYALSKTEDFVFSDIYQAFQQARLNKPNYVKSPELYIRFVEKFLKDIEPFGVVYQKGGSIGG